MATQDALHFKMPEVLDNQEGWGPTDAPEQAKDTPEPFHFRLPDIHDNPEGWGPSDVPEQFKDTPYQPFSKGDRLGKVCGTKKRTSSRCVVVSCLCDNVSTCPVRTCVGRRLEWQHVQ